MIKSVINLSSVERRLFGVVRHSVFRYVAAKSKALALHIKNGIWKARAFLPSMDGQVAGCYAKYQKQHCLRYGEQGWFPTTSQKHYANNKIDIPEGLFLFV